VESSNVVALVVLNFLIFVGSVEKKKKKNTWGVGKNVSQVKKTVSIYSVSPHFFV